MFLGFFFTQATDAGILGDDIQRFFRIAKAVELIKSSSDDEIKKLSERLESYLIDISSYMRRVVSYIFFLSLLLLFHSQCSSSRGGGGGGARLYGLYRYVWRQRAGHGFQLFWSQI